MRKKDEGSEALAAELPLCGSSAGKAATSKGVVVKVVVALVVASSTAVIAVTATCPNSSRTACILCELPSKYIACWKDKTGDYRFGRVPYRFTALMGILQFS